MYGNRSRNRLKGWRIYPQTFVFTPLCDVTSLRAMMNNLLHVISILRLRILCDFEIMVPKSLNKLTSAPKTIPSSRGFAIMQIPK